MARAFRELCLHDGDLIVLAGPTMDLEGAMQMFSPGRCARPQQRHPLGPRFGALKVLF